MPKRPTTPETGDDEPIYFSVVNPWPQNANMELPGDLTRCVQWLAEALGDPGLLIAVFHRPSSPRLIIIEVNRKYRRKEYKESPGYRRILGKHAWVGPQGILQDPPRGLSEVNYSSIFYSCYNTGRKVEKNGWKRKWVEDHMLGTPATRAEVFKRPYPPTSFIEAPTHDQTSLQFCLNLPRAEFDSTEIIVRPVAATAPVGSSTWITLKGLQPPRKDIPDTKEVEFNDTSNLQTENQMEPVNLWAEADGKDPIPVLSDLPSMSKVGDDESGICPFHGLSCKKMCAWRTEYQRRRGPKVGGPSNVKNYNPRPPKAGPKSPVGKTDRTPASVSGNQNFKAPARAPPPPLHIMTARGNGRGITPISPATSSPNAASPISDGSPTGPIATHQVSPPIRGTPVWASRGRGRGRGSS